MGTKSQHAAAYRRLPAFLRLLRQEAGLTQSNACELEPLVTFVRFLKSL